MEDLAAAPSSAQAAFPGSGPYSCDCHGSQGLRSMQQGAAGDGLCTGACGACAQASAAGRGAELRLALLQLTQRPEVCQETMWPVAWPVLEVWAALAAHLQACSGGDAAGAIAGARVVGGDHSAACTAASDAMAQDDADGAAGRLLAAGRMHMHMLLCNAHNTSCRTPHCRTPRTTRAQQRCQHTH